MGNDVFTKIDTFLNTFLTTIAQKIQTLLSGEIGTLLLVSITLYIVIYGYMVLAGIGGDTPKSSRYDQQMQYINYNPHDVVEIRTKDGFVTAVTFAEDEEVTDIASGFSDGWEVKDNKNNIYIKPKALQQDSNFFEPKVGEWDTNLLIATNKRTYGRKTLPCCKGIEEIQRRTWKNLNVD
ncbi:TrbG/VirB9 family P-type conjugative transfer protein [Pasteurella sp. PK-2025]|uniref:TrbG/VirB9 family P-type conjugative transfer protein n=1 Tax=Pasteurella sp. PK-2025 TaxID=3413133 RepID=UPI003C70E949